MDRTSRMPVQTKDGTLWVTKQMAEKIAQGAQDNLPKFNDSDLSRLLDCSLEMARKQPE